MPPLLPADVTLGILAGGQASRLGGVDKAWLQRDGVPQVARVIEAYAAQVKTMLVSANRDLSRYESRGLRSVPDAHPGIGPLAGLDALARACQTRWLFTLPVDLVEPGEQLLRLLAAAGNEGGAVAEDEDGLQPLVALWPVIALRGACAAAIAQNDLSVQALQAHIGMPRVRLPGVRLGNLNTPSDLVSAGIAGA